MTTPADDPALSSATESSVGAPVIIHGRGSLDRPDRLWWRALCCGVLMLLGVLAVSGCGGPSVTQNALLVHVVAPHCDHEPRQQPLLVVEKVVEGWGKATVNEWRTLRRLDECREPFAEHAWEGDVLQVWVSDYEWTLRKQARLQLGHRVTGNNTWAVGDEDRLRVDYQHVFLGTIDVGPHGAEFIPPGAVGAIVAQLEDRQGCERRPGRDRGTSTTHCTDEWEHADLFTFEVAAEAPVSPWHSDPPPPTEEEPRRLPAFGVTP